MFWHGFFQGWRACSVLVCYVVAIGCWTTALMALWQWTGGGAFIFLWAGAFGSIFTWGAVRVEDDLRRGD